MAIFGTGPALQQTTVTSAGQAVFALNRTVNGTAFDFTNTSNVTVVNTGPSVVYVGGASVSTSSGIPVAVGNQLTLRGPAVALRAICNSGQSSVVEAGLTTEDATN